MKQTNFQLVLPLNFEIFIPENDSVRLVSQIVDELDFRKLNLVYSSKGRNPSVKPRVLFSILIYAYMNGIYSSRQIEKACKRDINFMWLLEGNTVPDHNTIDRFRRERLSLCLEDLFAQFVEKLYQMDEIAFENLYIDGTKLEANANKYSFVWKKSIERNAEKQAEKISALLSRINGEFGTAFKETAGDATLNEAAVFLLNRKAELNTEFVKGTGKRKSLLQKLTEECLEILEKKRYYEECLGTFGNRNSFSKTDKDATFMHMKDDHMRNSQLKPGYNMQIGVEAGYVVHCQAFQNRDDMRTLKPFLEQWKTLHPKSSFENIITDSGYESEENYTYLTDEEKNIYIKPQTYEQWKKRSFKKLISKRENMAYDVQSDTYTCNQGRTLAVTRVYKSKTDSGFETELTEYECDSCMECPVKSKCTRAAGNRKIQVSKRFLNQREVSLANISSPTGIVLRLNRSIQAEGAFAVIKEDMGFRRFLTRGQLNISTEFMLLCFGFNINKLHNKRIKGKLGFKLYKEELLKKAA
jgi:transposase